LIGKQSALEKKDSRLSYLLSDYHICQTIFLLSSFFFFDKTEPFLMDRAFIKKKTLNPLETNQSIYDNNCGRTYRFVIARVYLHYRRDKAQQNGSCS